MTTPKLNSAVQDIYIGTRAVACSGQGGWHDQANGLDDALLRLTARLQATPARIFRPAVRLWLSGALCRPFIWVAPAGLADHTEFENVARSLAPAQLGIEGPCAVWAEELAHSAAPSAQAMPPRLVVGMSQPALDQCLAVLHRARRRPVAVVPWWAGVLNAALCRSGVALPELLGVRDCDSLTVLAGSAGQFALASTAAPLADPASARAAWMRASVTHAATPGHVLRVQFAPELGAQRLDHTTADVALQMPWARIQP